MSPAIPCSRLTLSVLLAGATLASGAVARADGYPQVRIDRPRTLPVGMLQLGLGASTGEALEPVGLRIDAGFAPLANLEARVLYAPQIAGERDMDRPVVLSLRHFTLKRAPRFWLATQLDVPVHATGDVVRDVVFGVPAKLKLGAHVALYAGDRLVDLGVTGTMTALIGLPVELGIQVANPMMLQIGTTLARIPIGDRPDLMKTVTIADVTPVVLGGWFSPDARMDLGLQIGATDAQRLHDTVVITLNLAVRARR